jgi:plasmid maintenance system antidote protein VapI
MLREDYLPDYGLNVSAFAKALRVSRQTVNDLWEASRAIKEKIKRICPLNAV